MTICAAHFCGSKLGLIEMAPKMLHGMCVRTRQQADPRALASLIPSTHPVFPPKTEVHCQAALWSRRQLFVSLRQTWKICALWKHIARAEYLLAPLYLTHLLHFELLSPPKHLLQT